MGDVEILAIGTNCKTRWAEFGASTRDPCKFSAHGVSLEIPNSTFRVPCDVDGETVWTDCNVWCLCCLRIPVHPPDSSVKRSDPCNPPSFSIPRVAEDFQSVECCRRYVDMPPIGAYDDSTWMPCRVAIEIIPTSSNIRIVCIVVVGPAVFIVMVVVVVRANGVSVVVVDVTNKFHASERQSTCSRVPIVIRESIAHSDKHLCVVWT
mmetsp:Transcript_14745/g.55825  ORF Transcript_14745/g.55825 Transcript_14745/m.55825 type:complete len:207 (-) Transcript_14745:2515-3135(-)